MGAPNELPSLRKLGSYLVGRKLGSGGMAHVYAARFEGSHATRLVALKVLSSAISKEDPEHRAFMREALLATRLEHPNIVRTYDVGEIAGTMYLAMELVHGAPLSALQKALGGPAPTDIVLRIVSDVARALHAAHELEDAERGHLGVVHQDVSPHNVLVGYDGAVKLVDFGVARLSTLEGSRTESLRGKPSYASPEQINGKNIDRRTDVFALGVVAWELFAGERLFRRETSAATYLAVLNAPIPDLQEKNPEVPEAVAHVIATALVRERDGRYSTVEAFRRALANAQREAGVQEADADAVSRWANALVPPAITPAELEREIVSTPLPPEPVDGGDARPSAPRVAPAASAAAPVAPMAEVPDLDVPAPSRSRAPAPDAAAPVSRAPVVPPPAQVASGGAARAALSEVDELDMEIERNVSASALPTAVSSRSSGVQGVQGLHAARSSGLEVSYSRPSARPVVEDDERTSGVALAVGFGLAAALAAAATFGLVRVAHAPGGRDLLALAPHAFDGTSATASGVVSIACFVLALAIGGVGLKLAPRSWVLVGSGGALLLTALAMVTVTLASTGADPTPPDGVLLVPYLVPSALVLLGLGVTGRAGRLFAAHGAARKASALPVAAVAGALLFLAYETSKLAAM